MAPDPGKQRTIGCCINKSVPDAAHRRYIEKAVNRVHEATVHATELINLHIRRCLKDNVSLDNIFNGNWIIKAFNEVTETSGRKETPDAELAVSMKLMPPIKKVKRNGLTQLMQANANMLATVAHNNVWMHFRKRVHSHVKRIWLPPTDQRSKEENKLHRLELYRLTDDLLCHPDQPLTTAADKHDWIRNERLRLGIDNAVQDWKNKPLSYHLKAKAHRFIPIMALMSKEQEMEGRKAFSLFPLRRSMVPKHVRFDKASLCQVMEALRNEECGRKRKQPGDSDFTFESVLNYNCIRTTKQWEIKDGFTTDGVCVRLQQSKPKAHHASMSPKFPLRGMWAIDELKRLSRLEELHIVGIDPGLRELVVAVDQDDTRSKTVRYTQVERQKDIRSRQYRDEMERSKPIYVRMSEEAMANSNSKSASLDSFRKHIYERQDCFQERLDFYAQVCHRQRRWKTYIKSQQSEEKLYAKLKGMHKKSDTRKLVLAYGSWGLIAGKNGACKKGNPPCIGVGLMRKLAQRFIVAPTPEHYTSKTCCKCFSECGPWSKVEAIMKRNRGIRGLRICQNDNCNLPQNRDRTGASNIGVQFCRLFRNEGPIKQMTKEELEFHRHNLCLHCDEE